MPREGLEQGRVLSISPPPLSDFLFCTLLEEFVVGHAKGREEAGVLLKIDLVIVILVKAFHQLVDPTILHFLQGRKGLGSRFCPKPSSFPLECGATSSRIC